MANPLRTHHDESTATPPISAPPAARRRRRIFAGLAAGLALALTLSACSGGSQADGGEPTEGGQASQVVSVDQKTWDPAKITSIDPTTAAAYLDLVLGHLLTSDITTGEVSDGFAESLTPNEDARVWTLKLKDGIKFTDGTAYDAAAVKFNWDRLADPKTAATSGELARTMTTTVVDPLTLKIELEAPNVFLDTSITNRMGFIMSPEAIRSDPNVFTTNPVGAGPFMLDEAVPGSYFSFTKNPDYYEKGKPHLDKVTLRVVTTLDQQRNSVLAGEIDVHPSNSSETLDFYKQNAGDRIELHVPELSGARLMVFNTTRPPFDDVRARRAVTLAVKADELAGIQEKSETSAAPQYLLSESSPWFSDKYPMPTYDPDEAQRLFNELAAEGKPVKGTILNYGSAGGTKSMLEFMANKLNAYDNVDLSIDNIQISALMERGNIKRDFDILPRPGIAIMATPSPGLENNIRSGALGNSAAGYSNPKMDAALDAVMAAPTLEGQKKAMEEVMRIWSEDVPYWAYGNITHFTAVNPGLTNVNAWGEGIVLWADVQRTS